MNDLANLPELPAEPSAHESAVYRWVVRHGHLELPAAAAELGLTPDEVAEALRTLLERGLVIAGDGTPARLHATDPDLVSAVVTAPMVNVIRSVQTQMGEVRLQYANLRAEYLNGVARRSTAVEVIPRLPEVRAAIERASAECRSEVIASQPGGNRDPAVLGESYRRDSEILARGVRIRALYNHTARFNGPSQAYVRAMSERGAEYRTAHELFGRLIVFDRELAFIPDTGDTWGAVMIRDGSVVTYLCEVFEKSWTLAQPFADAAADGLEVVAGDLDRTIASLLAAGMKDEAIGRRLGMSLRTTRRHIADIMEELGAQSRFQAGVLMASHGLLDEETHDAG